MGCELLSDCIFDLLNTASWFRNAQGFALWIAFRLYLWLIEHSWRILYHPEPLVVNCFQIVSLTYWTQQIWNVIPASNSCELLSDCIFDLLNTAYLQSNSLPERCELLSDCIFDLLNTALARETSRTTPLWIAFRLYLWLIEHSFPKPLQTLQRVVNCFQIVSLTYWTQRRVEILAQAVRCELLSDCIFDLLNTAIVCIRCLYGSLWIAFRLYLWLIEHSILI